MASQAIRGFKKLALIEGERSPPGETEDLPAADLAAEEEEEEEVCQQSGALEVFFLTFSTVKNDWFAFFIRLTTYFCTSPV